MIVIHVKYAKIFEAKQYQRFFEIISYFLEILLQPLLFHERKLARFKQEFTKNDIHKDYLANKTNTK